MDLVNFNPHVHVLAADGAFLPDGRLVTLPAVPGTRLAEGFRRAVLEFLVNNRSKMPLGLKRNFQVMPGAQWLTLLCKHIPDRYDRRKSLWDEHLVRFRRLALEPGTRPAPNEQPSTEFAARAKATWARLMHKVPRASSRRVTTLGPTAESLRMNWTDNSAR